MEEENPKRLKTASFAVHATRGILRDRGVRRKTIFVLLVTALLMVIAGSTFLQELLNPREHFGWFALFWLVCGWLTITSLLLALFDILLLRAEDRAARRALRKEVTRSQFEE